MSGVKSALRHAFGTLEDDPRAEQRRRILAAAGLKPDGTPIASPKPAPPVEDASPTASPPASPRTTTADGAVYPPAPQPASSAEAAALPAPPVQPVPRGRRRIRVTPIYVREGLTVLATWGGKKWRAEVAHVFLDLPLAAEAAIARRAGNPEPCVWRADVKFQSDETEAKGILITDLAYVTEDHTLAIDPAMDARRIVIGDEAVDRDALTKSEATRWRELRRGMAGSFTSAQDLEVRRIHDAVAADETRARQAIQLQQEAERGRFAIERADSYHAAELAATARRKREADLRAVAEREAAAAAARQAAQLKMSRLARVQAAARARISQRLRELCRYAASAKAAAEAAQRMVSVGVQADFPSGGAVETPEPPRLSQFPARAHRITSRATSPAASPQQRPPFRVTSLHPEIPPLRDYDHADSLPAPKGTGSRAGSRATSPAPGRTRSRSRSPRAPASGAASPGRQTDRAGTPTPARLVMSSGREDADDAHGHVDWLRVSSKSINATPRHRTPAPSGYATPLPGAGTPGRSHSPADLHPTGGNVAYASAGALGRHVDRGWTPGKPSPLPRGPQVPSRYLRESITQPTSLAGYLRLARHSNPQ